MKQLFSKKIFKSSIAISVYSMLIVFALTQLGIFYPETIEWGYSNRVYPLIAIVLSTISDVFPFSLDDLFYAFLILFLLSHLVLLLFKKVRFIVFIKRLVILVSASYCCFNVFWGFNYYRQDATERLGLSPAQADVTKLMDVFSWLAEETNRTYTPIYTLDKANVLQQVQLSYKQQATFLKIDDRLIETVPKSISLSRLFAAATISGYYGPFFNEVHLNDYLLTLDYPHVLAHEMAHKLGVTSEAEANFYAWLVCSKSNDKQLAYSANLYLLHYFVYECYKYDGFKDVVKNIRYEVRHDFYKSRYHWMLLMNQNVELVATKVNDAYLKSNNVEEGIEDYEGVVKYVMDYLQSEQMSH